MAEKKAGSKLHGPLYTPPTPGKSLGAENVEGPKGGASPADPLGYVKKGKGKGK